MAPDETTGLQRMLAYLRGDRPDPGIVHLLGIKPVAMESGVARFESVPSGTHNNPGGATHGGYITTLLDTAMGCAGITLLGTGKTLTTIELKVSFLRAVTPETGRVTAEGRVISHGRRVIFTEAMLTDGNGRKLASASSTLMILDR